MSLPQRLSRAAPICELLEPRLLLSATYEVWGGDTDFTPLPEHWNYYYSIDQQDYTKLGEAEASHTFAGDFDYYVIAARDSLMLDAIQGSDGSFYSGPLSTGNTDDWWSIFGPPDRQYATMGPGQTGGTYSSFVVLWNPGGQWSGLTVYLDDHGAENAPFQADLTEVHYQDAAGREIDYDFSTGLMDGTGVIAIPEASVPGRTPGEETTTFVWEPGEGQTTNLLDTSRGVYTMSLPQASSSVDEMADGWSSMGAWGPTAPPAADWSFEAAFSGVRNTAAEQTYYTVRVGAGTWEDAVSPYVTATWFTGVYGGAWCDSVLVLSASVEDEINDQGWSSPDVGLPGYDPLTTTVALKAEVQDGITFTAWYALNGGAWQVLWQHTISEGQMAGFPNLYPTVSLETGRVPGPTEVEVVRGVDYEAPGTADDAYEYNVNAGGYYLTDLDVTTPWGEVFHASDYLPPDWVGEYVEYEGGRLSFEAYGAGAHRQLDVSWEGLSTGEWAALDTGQTLLCITAGSSENPLAWAGVVDFAAVTQPTQVPTLVDPADGQTGVSLRPEIRWEPWAAPGTESTIRINLQDDARTGPAYEDFLSAGLDAWKTPVPLDPATLYQVELAFVNWSGLTVDGLGINVLAMTESDPRFTTAEPGVTGASVDRGLDYGYPDATGPTRDYAVSLAGIGLTGLTVTTPWGETFDLGDYYAPGWPVAEYLYGDGRIDVVAETSADGECQIEIEWLLTEAEWAALDTGDTTLLAAYGAGSWGGVFDFAGVAVPADVANITSPVHEATGVGFYPVFAWDPWSAPGPDAVVAIDLEEVGTPGGEAVEDWLGPGGTTWTVPDPLGPDTTYQFGVTFANTAVVSTGGVDVQIVGYTDSDILFTTAEAGVADVRILCGTDYVVPGTARDDVQALGVTLRGYGLTGAEIVLPWGETVDTADLLPPGWDGSQDVWLIRGALDFGAYRDDGMDCLEFWWDWLSDSQWAAVLAGSVGVTVGYTGGTWSQMLDFAGLDLVDQEPAPTAPVHREVEAGPLVAEWAPWALPAPGAVIEVWAWDEYGLENQELDEGEELPASATSWVLPDRPDPTAVYGFGVAFLNRVTETIGGAKVVRETATHNQVLFVSGADVPADDHGNTSAAATPVAAPVSVGAPTVVAGTLGYAGDVDFFRFEAVAGQTYEIRVSLPEGGLEDSTLWLYGRDGKTLLAWDDDSGPNCGSYLVRKGWGGHTWYLAVDAYSLEEQLGAYTLSIALSEKTSDSPDALMYDPSIWLLVAGDVGAGFSLNATGAVSGDEGLVLHRLDLSDPFAPASELGAYYLGGLEGVAFSDDAQRLYYGDDTNAWEWLGASELVALDLSAGGDPVEVWRVLTQERDVDSVAIAGHYLYAGTQPDDGTLAYLEVYDLSDPATAVFVGQSPALTAPAGGEPFADFDPGDITVSGDRVYILHDGRPTISILDVSDPAAPVLLGQYVVPVTADDSIMSVAARGHTLVLGLDGEVWFVDLSDPAAPGAPVVVPVPGGTVTQVLVRGPLVFVGCSQAGVRVFDLTDPASPVLVADYDYVGASGSVAVAEGAVLVPTSRGEMAVFVDETPQVVRWTGDDDESWQNGSNWSSLAVPERWVTAVFEGAPGCEPVLYADEAVWGVDVRSPDRTVMLGQSGLAVGEGGLSIAGGASPTSTIDVGAGRLVVDYAEGDAGPLADVAAWLQAGMGPLASPWGGQGITSSVAAADAAHLTAVGMLDNADPKSGGKTEFAGRAVDATSVLVAYTWWGDANLDGVIDANDYDVIDKNYLFTPNPAAPWFTGDFTYDGVIDANDYDKIDKAYLFQTGPLAVGSPAALGQEMPAAQTSADVLETDVLAMAAAALVRPTPVALAGDATAADFALAALAPAAVAPAGPAAPVTLVRPAGRAADYVGPGLGAPGLSASPAGGDAADALADLLALPALAVL